MLFDTDVLIWALRGNPRAADVLDADPARSLSIVSYMELLQGARDRREMEQIRRFLSSAGFRTIPLSENAGHRAALILEAHVLRTALGLADALVAATALEEGLSLCTGNVRHFHVIPDLAIHAFRP